jgi:mitochondrial inner membrane protease subunit 1
VVERGVGRRPHYPAVHLSPTRLAALALLAAAAVAALPRTVVEGRSMVPTLLPGDRLVVLPLPPAAGRLLVVRDPRAPARLLVKRCARVLPDGSVDVRGDAPDGSTDSRHFGPVPRRLVVGRPVHRYEPAARAGWVWRA